jgi:hypothetical protein
MKLIFAVFVSMVIAHTPTYIPPYPETNATVSPVQQLNEGWTYLWNVHYLDNHIQQ